MARRAPDEGYFTAPVPQDVDRSDTVLFGLTSRQLLILGGAALALWLGWAAVGRYAPIAYLVAIVPVAGAAFVVAVGRRDGRSLDVWLHTAARFLRTPRRLVAADRPVQAPPSWVTTTRRTPVPAPLRLPAKGITADGVVSLGGHGHTALLTASTVNFALRSPTEQTGLIVGFARWLNSLDAPVQVLVRTRRIDLTRLADVIAEAAPSLPHQALEHAARAHVAFLDALGAERELLDRQVTIAVRDTRGPHRAAHRTAEAARALGACEVNARTLDGAETVRELADCWNPPTTTDLEI